MACYMLAVSLGNAFTALINALIRDPADGSTLWDGVAYCRFFVLAMALTSALFVPFAMRWRDAPPTTALHHPHDHPGYGGGGGGGASRHALDEEEHAAEQGAQVRTRPPPPLATGLRTREVTLASMAPV